MTQAAAFKQFLDTLEQTQWAERSKLLAYQEGLLVRLLRHAHEQVPFYRDRLACLFTGGGAIDLARWNEVPILTRAEAAAHTVAMRSPSLPASYGIVRELKTSGSTTTPLQFATNELSQIAANAAETRLARWWGLDTKRKLAVIRIFAAGKAPPYPEGRDSNGWSRAEPDGDVCELDLFTPTEQQIEWLLRKRPAYLATSPSNALALAYAMTPDRARGLAIEAMICIAETVIPRVREVIADRFGAKLLALYSCQEIGAMATQCPITSHYHVVAETVVVEILREDGTTAAPGEMGQVVVTGLYNYAMPFIRYALGDVATAGPEFCSCGRTLPTIAQVEGRTRHAFVFRDGTRVWPRIWVLREVREFVPSRELQLAQIDHERIEIRYVPEDNDRPPDVEGLGGYMRSKFHPTAAAVLVPMAAIPRGKGGKFEPFISAVVD
jgi:phenylacetate-CoA ligase